MIQKNDLVTIPAGTPTKSTDPRAKRTVSKRAQTIKVHHTLPGRGVNVGFRSYNAEGEIDYEDFRVGDRFDMADLLAVYGKADETTLRPHFVEGTRQHRPNGTSYCYLFVAVENPSVVWVGSGGYWREAYLSDLGIDQPYTAP